MQISNKNVAARILGVPVRNSQSLFAAFVVFFRVGFRQSFPEICTEMKEA